MVMNERGTGEEEDGEEREGGGGGGMKKRRRRRRRAGGSSRGLDIYIRTTVRNIIVQLK